MVNLNISLYNITSISFSDFVDSISFEGNFFSTPRTTPSLVLMPIAVDPNFNQVFNVNNNDIIN